MNEPQNNKELGLIDILQIIGQWIINGVKKLISYALYLFFFGLKQWKILSTALLLVIIFTIICYYTQNSNYEANMLIRSNSMATAQMKPFIDNYSNLIGNKLLSNEEITKSTTLDSITRNDIISVSAFFCIDDDRDGIVDEVDKSNKIKPSAENLDSLNLCVRVLFQDVNVLPKVKKSLLYYINNEDYIKKVNIARIEQQNKKKEFILDEIKILDAMQQKSYGAADITNDLINKGSVLVDNRRVLDLYHDKVALWKLYESIEKEVNYFSEPITVVEDFVVKKTAINTLPTLLKRNLVYSFFVVYVLLLLFVYIRKEKNKYMAKL